MLDSTSALARIMERPEDQEEEVETATTLDLPEDPMAETPQAAGTDPAAAVQADQAVQVDPAAVVPADLRMVDPLVQDHSEVEAEEEEDLLHPAAAISSQALTTGWATQTTGILTVRYPRT